MIAAPSPFVQDANNDPSRRPMWSVRRLHRGEASMERPTGKVGVAMGAASQVAGVGTGAAAGHPVRARGRQGRLANRSAERAAAPEERSGMPTPLLLRADGATERGGRNHAEAL